MGMIAIKVCSVIRFHQKPWLAPYLDPNTKKRASTKDLFKKTFCILLNNAFYGKTMENVRNKIGVKFTNDEKAKMLNWQLKIDFDSVKSYDDFDAFNFKIKGAMFDKPICLGFTISLKSQNCSCMRAIMILCTNSVIPI